MNFSCTQLRVLRTLILLIATLPALAEDGVTGEQKHGDWHSLIINTPNSVFARAITLHVDSAGELSTFNIDSPIDECDSVYFTVNINLSEMQENSVESPTLFGKFRVDRNPVHDITYTLSIERGENYISLMIDEWSRSDSVLTEIMSGDTARFQFKIDDEAYYYRFSLAGSREAIERQDQICRQLKERADEEFFEEPDEEDDDASYFIT